MPVKEAKKKVFHKTQEKKDIVPYNQRIASAAKDKNLTHALEQWDRIMEGGMIPTPHTFCGMVNAFVRCGQLSRAEEFVARMEKSIPLDARSREGFTITLTALLKGYFMSSAFSRSHELFKKIISVSGNRVGSRTLDTYLRGCLRTGAFQQGIAAFESTSTEKSDMSKIYAAKMTATRLAVKLACEIGGDVDPGVCVHIGCAYVRMAKSDKAKAWFDRARELLFTAAPERQFDKLQKSELVRVCDFFTGESSAPAETKNSIDKYIGQFLIMSENPAEQADAWRALGLDKYKPDADIASLARSSIDELKRSIEKHNRKNRPVIVEVCSGAGEWIARAAEKDRKQLFIAVEFRFDRCVELLTRQAFLQLDNLWILCGDARGVSGILPTGSLSELHVNYPEPPPVNSSHIEEEMSSDIVTKKFLRQVKTLMIPETGKLSIVSDDKLYINTVCNTVNDAWGVEVFPKSSKTLVDSYFARFFSKKAKRWSIEAVVP